MLHSAAGSYQSINGVKSSHVLLLHVYSCPVIQSYINFYYAIRCLISLTTHSMWSVIVVFLSTHSRWLVRSSLCLRRQRSHTPLLHFLPQPGTMATTELPLLHLQLPLPRPLTRRQGRATAHLNREGNREGGSRCLLKSNKLTKLVYSKAIS